MIDAVVTRRAFLAAAAAAIASPHSRRRRRPLDIVASATPVPSASQLAWQRDELAMFLHFGVNTFTDREWGDGREDPSIFAPSRLDARQWASAARAGGFRALILTAKHHDGFCLWPTRTTRHSVAGSPWRGGAGDVVREFVDACRGAALRPGLYLSPWDRNSPVYGDSPRYNDLYCDQLTELLTNYGPMAEAWFDGANGEGPNGRRQEYDWPRVFALVRRLQPGAVMFSDAGPDVRWCGNEAGSLSEPNWSTVDPASVAYPGASGPGVIESLQHGDPSGTVWRPAEADTSIRPGWFYHPAEDARVKTADTLVDLYFATVGHNSKLLLNVPPTRDGVLHDVDVQRLAAFDDRRRGLFAKDLAKGRKIEWSPTGSRTATAAIDLGLETRVSIVRLEEPIEHGQAIASFTIEGFARGEWHSLASGMTIGYARLVRIESARLRRLRVVVRGAIATPRPIAIRVFG